MDYHRMNSVNIRIVRIFNTYGPRMHPFDGRVVSNFIRQALAGEDITIFGDGSQTRSFCYRDDLVEGIIRMMNGPDDFIGPVNLGNPDEFTIHELAETDDRADRLDIQDSFTSRCPADDPDPPPPDIYAGQRKTRLGTHDPSARRAGQDDRLVPRHRLRKLPTANAEFLAIKDTRRPEQTNACAAGTSVAILAQFWRKFVGHALSRLCRSGTHRDRCRPT